MPGVHASRLSQAIDVQGVVPEQLVTACNLGKSFVPQARLSFTCFSINVCEEGLHNSSLVGVVQASCQTHASHNLLSSLRSLVLRSETQKGFCYQSAHSHQGTQHDQYVGRLATGRERDAVVPHGSLQQYCSFRTRYRYMQDSFCAVLFHILPHALLLPHYVPCQEAQSCKPSFMRTQKIVQL